MIEAALVYSVGVVILMGSFVIRTPHGDVPVMFLLSLFWPVSIVLIALMFLLSAVGWEIDTAENTKMFGFRKPTNTKVRGVAVTLFGTEIQFYSTKKVD